MSDKPDAPRDGVRLLVLAALVGLAAASRLLVYSVPESWGIAGEPVKNFLWNFTPIAAIALFSGAKFRPRWLALIIPLLAMWCSDALLHLTGLAPLASPEIVLQQFVVYVTFAVVVGIGIWVGKQESVSRVAAGTLAGSTLFYLVTNFVFWLTVSETLPEEFRYPRTFSGLLTCYYMALPFFRNSLIADLIYVPALFGGLALATKMMPALRPAPEIRPQAV